MSIKPGKNRVPIVFAPLAIIAAVALQDVGGAVAKTTFGTVGADGMIALRLSIAALILFALQRPWRTPIAPRHWPGLLVYGVVLGGISILLYRAFALLPIGIVVGIQAIGPLAVVLLTSRKAADVPWFLLATTGIWLLVPQGSTMATLDPLGLAYAGASAASWALYILCGKLAARSSGIQSVSWGMAIGAIITMPFGLVAGGAALLKPSVLAAGLVVAILSSVVPNTLEMAAMRHLPHRVLGILLSAAPAFAALAGFLVLGERLLPLQWFAIILLMAASAGSALTAARQA